MVCTEKEEGIPVVKERKRRDTRIFSRTIEEGVH